MTWQNDFVFHGSHQMGLKEIIPSPDYPRPDISRPLVFATRYKAMASCFLLHKDLPCCRIFYNQDGLIFFVTRDFDHIRAHDRGGSIYTLPAEDFVHTPYDGMRYMEWMSSRPKPIIREERFQSAIRAMQYSGVKIVLLSDALFTALVDKFDPDLFIRLKNEEMDNLSDYFVIHNRKANLQTYLQAA